VTTRKGLTQQAVVTAAAAVVDADGPDALTVTRVARELGVRPPSLYSHVASLDALRRGVALAAIAGLGDVLGAAAMGRAGGEALRALSAAFREYAGQHPGLYELTTAARRDDAEFAAASLGAVAPVLAVLAGCGLVGADAIHAARTLRSALHGFVSLENVGGFGLDVDVDASFEWLVTGLVSAITAAPESLR